MGVLQSGPDGPWATQNIDWVGPELDMDWIHPWIGLDWIGLGQDFEETLWIGLDWVR